MSGKLLPTILVTIFGSSTWLIVNAVWMQLPQLVDVLPEQWKLPSYLALIVQLGDIAALIIGVGFKSGIKFNENGNFGRFRTWLIVVLLIFAIILTLVLSFEWAETAIVFGKNQSVALFVLFFLLSMYCSATNLVFLPHMTVFDSYLVTPFFIGMGVSALVPSLLALVQGVDAIICIPNNITNNSTSNQTSYFTKTVPPNFSVGVFMQLMAVWNGLALGAFGWLTVKYSNRHEYTPGSSRRASKDDGVPTKLNPATNLSSASFLLFLLLTGWLCVWMNSILPSIQIYACRPYGPETYHLSLTLSNLANPIACIIAMKFTVKKMSSILMFTIVSTVICAYIVSLAAMSPTPPLVHSGWGAAHAILVSVIAMSLLAYLRAIVAQIVRESAQHSENRLFWCGAASQFGSVFGALAVFPIVNVLELFKMADQCQPAVF